MSTIVSWITSHYQDVLTVYSSIIIAARLIIKLLPYPAAGTVLESIVTFLGHLGLVVQTPTNTTTTSSATSSSK